MRALLVLLLMLLPASVAWGEHAYEGARLEVRGEVPEAWIETSVKLVDALYPALVEHFGRAPTDAELPLTLVLHPDRASYERTLRARGVMQKTGHTGGWTFWKDGDSHVFLQKSDWHTRRLILHELTHQFHAKCRPASRRGKGAWWYREGLAEWFGWHEVTKDGVTFGVVDAFGQRGTATDVPARLARKDFDAFAIGSGKAKADYASALAVLAPLLAGTDPALTKTCQAWQAEVLERGGDSAAFRRRFEDKGPALNAAVRSFWQARRARWQVDAGTWSRTAGVLTGSADDAPARLRRIGPRGREQRVTVLAPGGGLYVHGVGRTHTIVWTGREVVVREGTVREGGVQWKPLASWPLTGDAPVTLTLSQRAPDSWHKLHNSWVSFEAGREGILKRWPADPVDDIVINFDSAREEPHVGLFVAKGRTRFRDFETGDAQK